MKQKNVIKLLAVASNFIFELLLALGVGYFLGQYIDGIFETNSIWTALLMVLFSLFTLIIFMRRIYVIGQRNE